MKTFIVLITLMISLCSHAESILLGSDFGTMGESRLIIADGLFLATEEADVEAAVYKSRFIQTLNNDQQYRSSILKTLGLQEDAQILAVSLKNCQGKSYLDEDYVRFISCDAVVIVK